MNPDIQTTATTTVTDTVAPVNENNRKKLLILGAGLLLALVLIVAAILLTQSNNGRNTSNVSSLSSTTVSTLSAASSFQSTQTSQPVSSTVSSAQGEARTTTIKFGAVGEEDTFTFAYTLPAGFSVNMVDSNNSDLAYSFFDLINSDLKVILSFGTDPDGFPTAVEGMDKIKPITNAYHQGINRGLVENDTFAFYGKGVTTGSACAFRNNDSDVCLDTLTVTAEPIAIVVSCKSTEGKALSSQQLAACDQIVGGTKFTVQPGS